MENEHLIPVQELCTHHHIEISFITSLNKSGLIAVTTVEENQYIDEKQLKELEKMIRLHYDLDINIEGIEAISHLLNRVNSLQEELISLRNRLGIYEDR
jgi:hypothetical protein